MQQLWAPWRMSYIGDSGGNNQGCVFCTKAAQDEDEKNLIVVRGSRCFVMLNLYPYNNGHLMVVPIEHQPSINNLAVETLTELMTLAQKSLTALTAAMHPQGFNLGINQGDAAGAGIADHMHLHIVPRWSGDTNFMPVLADVKVMPDYLHHTYEQVREQLLPLMS